ncbi:MAG: acetate--CoA ligase family protein, partial [Alphaproteobacteria bacterium]
QALGAMWEGIMALDLSHPMLVIDWPAEGTGPTHTWDVAIEAVAHGLRTPDRRAGIPALVASLPENMPGHAAEKIAALGMIPGHGLEDHIQAVAGAASIGAHRQGLAAGQRRAPIVLAGGDHQNPSSAVRMLNEAEAKTLLGQHGLPVAAHRACRTRQEAVDAVSELGAEGRPCAMKILGDFAHKTELGGVRLGLAADDLEAVREAADSLLAIAPAVLVEPMADKPVVELILGVAQDPVLGLHLVLGAGGVLTEILADSEILLFPYGEADVRHALESLRIWPLLQAYRGGAQADVEAVVTAVLALGDFVEAHANRLIELDINPLFVHPLPHQRDRHQSQASGVTVVDALIRMID